MYEYSIIEVNVDLLFCAFMDLLVLCGCALVVSRCRSVAVQCYRVCCNQCDQYSVVVGITIGAVIVVDISFQSGRCDRWLNRGPCV
jgi:hypothetical protein